MATKQAQQVGRYHIMDRIAYGGMAEIFRAKTFEADASERIVVIKKVLAHLTEDQEFIDMLIDEAKIASTLEHPNIAQIFEFGQIEGSYFIAMEYVDGKDVRSILDKCRAERRRLSIENCVYIVTQALRGLHMAHNACDVEGRKLGIVHRDVSPSNIICGYGGEIKIIDFGIAKARMSRVRTKTGVIKGKVKYMSPEQAMGRELDGRSDIFSAGSVLYEMLTKVPPFQAPSELDLIFRVREAEYTPPSKRNPRVPRELEKILRKAMARSRSVRYLTCAELADDLAAFLYAIRPDYEPSEMARFLKRLYADEIERELRALEEYVVGDASESDADLGVNLLADALPPSSPWHEFRPVGEQATVLFDTATQGLLPVESKGEPDDRPIHQRPTMILRDPRLLTEEGRSIHDEPTLYIALRKLPEEGPRFPVVPRGLAAAEPVPDTTIMGRESGKVAKPTRAKSSRGRKRKKRKTDSTRVEAPPTFGSEADGAVIDETSPTIPGAPHVLQALFDGDVPKGDTLSWLRNLADEGTEEDTATEPETEALEETTPDSPPLPIDAEDVDEPSEVTEDPLRALPMIHRLDDIAAEGAKRGAKRPPKGGKGRRHRRRSDHPTDEMEKTEPQADGDEVFELSDADLLADEEVLELSTGDVILEPD